MFDLRCSLVCSFDYYRQPNRGAIASSQVIPFFKWWLLWCDHSHARVFSFSRGDGHVLVITVTGADAPGRSGAEARAAAAGRANSEAARTHRKAAGTEPGDGQAR